MTENTITLDLTDKNVVGILTAVNGEVKSAKFYENYVTAHGVTRENLAAHGTAFGDAWLVKYGTKADHKVGPVQRLDGKRTNYGNAVQAAKAGMTRALGKADSAEETDVKFLTAAGQKAATLDEVLTKVKAEYAAAHQS